MRANRTRCLFVCVLVSILPGATSAEPDWAAAGRDVAELLSGYIRIDTVNPPGNEAPGAEYLDAWFGERGLRGRLIESAPGRSNLLLRVEANAAKPDDRKPLLLLHHIDVVPADPEAWSFPPFSGAIEDGFVYGRGALDDKGQGAVFAVALALLHSEGPPRSRDLVYLATPDEETGGPTGARFMVENHWQELGPPAVVWNEGGIATRNALVSDRVLSAIATTEKRALWLTLSAAGEGGHGSQPVTDGANNRLLRALARIDAYETPLRITAGVGEMFRRVGAGVGGPLGLLLGWVENPLVLRLAGGELTQSRITNAMVRDTISITGLTSGLKHNVIPRRAEAKLDIRLLPDTDAGAFVSDLRRVIADPEVQIEGLPDPLPPTLEPSPVDNELFAALEAEMQREIPDGIVVPLQTTGGTDSGYFRRRGVPSYGFMPAVLPEELTSSIHGLDERVPTAELERAVRVTYRTLVRLTSGAAD